MTEPTPAQPHATPSRISRLTPTNSIAAYEQLLAAKETDLTRLQGGSRPPPGRSQLPAPATLADTD